MIREEGRFDVACVDVCATIGPVPKSAVKLGAWASRAPERYQNGFQVDCGVNFR